MPLRAQMSCPWCQAPSFWWKKRFRMVCFFMKIKNSPLGWAYGKNVSTQEKGMFPFNFVKLIEPAPPVIVQVNPNQTGSSNT